jgi:hypothetical protein
MASITRFLGNRANPASDNIVLAPVSTQILEPDEFKANTGAAL